MGRLVRQDVLYVQPKDFDRAFAYFKKCFNIWTQGYKIWGKDDFGCTFVKDPTVPSGVIMYCPKGERELAQPIDIPTSF